MTDTVSSDTIISLADKLAAFSEGLDPEERTALDRFFLTSIDSGDDVQGFGISVDDDGSGGISQAAALDGLAGTVTTASRSASFAFGLAQVVHDG